MPPAATEVVPRTANGKNKPGKDKSGKETAKPAIASPSVKTPKLGATKDKGALGKGLKGAVPVLAPGLPRDALSAAQVAAVSHRDAQIIDLPAVGVDQAVWPMEATGPRVHGLPEFLLRLRVRLSRSPGSGSNLRGC